VVFLEAYIQYHQLHDLPIRDSHPDSDPLIRIATDNKSLIARIYKGINTTTPFAGMALSAEYDVVNEITEIEKRLPL
jgi:hypothetical protein